MLANATIDRLKFIPDDLNGHTQLRQGRQQFNLTFEFQSTFPAP